jgi:hypothetical protein
MEVLTKEQIEFLSTQKISLGVVFNAEGLNAKERKSQMETLDMRFAYGVTPCRKMGHTLRSLAGDCIQCNTHVIAFTNRYFDKGFIYVSISSSKELLKIGCTKNVENRTSGLNNLSYGGINDWEIIFYDEVKENAGKIEFDIHKKLSKFFYPVIYLRNGMTVNCREIFKCDKNYVLETVKNLIDENR